ncbi:MAG: GHKL domain-containing protein [Lachnospiraceae bacterium]|nr:GHKL domain-containing protein [Lachnospiraceae bacterium]
MDFDKWLPVQLQFFTLIPSAASCYFAVKNQMRYTWSKTAAFCLATLLPYSFLAAWITAALQIDANLLLLPSLLLFFFLYRRTITTDLPRALAVYVGICAVQSFPVQFSYALDACLHPLSGANDVSAYAAAFHLGLSCLVAAAFAYPACHKFSWTVDHLDTPKIWYSTVILSALFLFFNILAVPNSYSTLHAGRMLYLFPLIQGCALVLLISIYLLFYQSAIVMLEHARLKEHSQLLEMQSHQYQTLKEHMRQTAALRHDFRHSVRLLSSLAAKGDLDNIQKYLSEYETTLAENTPADYCANAALNALFGYYHELAVFARIDTDWRTPLPEPLTASELDLAALFGNLMENAIAGCLTVPKEKRYFCLTTEIRHENSLYIVSTNSFDGKIRKGKGGYHSTKHSGRGTGLASIAAITEKYGGSAQISNNDQEFFVDVVLKL